MIKILALDVDGTLTDGRIYVGAQGELMKAFDVKDGYALVSLRDKGIEPVIITGRKSDIVSKRAEELKIKEVHQGVKNKLEVLKQIADKYECTLEEVAYMGDDCNDLECMSVCGVSACPSDAVDEVLDKVDYVCKRAGGRGAVREFIDYILKIL